MANIAVIGLCGASHFMKVDHFHKTGETLIANSYEKEYGGKGMNQAVAAARMGATVSYLGAVGCDEDGKAIERALKDEGIFAKLAVHKGPTTLAYILTDKSGENQVTEFSGTELTEEDVLTFEEEIKNCDFLLLQHEIPSSVNLKAAEIARKYQKRIILNPAPIRDIPEELRKSVFLITPNMQEAEGCDLEAFPHYIITLGDKGCSVDGKVNIPAIREDAVDTTGAGDTFCGTLAVCIAEGMSFEDAARWAVTASGISVTRKGVFYAIPYRNEIERKMNYE